MLDDWQFSIYTTSTSTTSVFAPAEMEASTWYDSAGSQRTPPCL